jgi:hypothetical protein
MVRLKSASRPSEYDTTPQFSMAGVTFPMAQVLSCRRVEATEAFLFCQTL